MRNPLKTALQYTGKWLTRSGFLSISDLDNLMDQAVGIGGAVSTAGVVVNGRTSLSYNPVLAAAKILGEELASLDLRVFEHQPDGGKVEVNNADSYRLRYEPNKYMSSWTWRSVMMGHAMWRGNAISIMNWDNRGALSSIMPIHPDRVRWKIEESGPREGQLWYYIHTKAGAWQPIPDDDILHIKGFGGDGISGYDIVSYLQESLGVPMAATRFGARYFANDATPGVILTHPGVLKETAHKNIRESFQTRHRGVDNAHVLGIIEEGMDVKVVGVQADKAQLLETRRFGTEDVSRITRIPLHMLGDLTHATFSNIEHQGLEFGRHCMRHWARNWEQELNRKLYGGTKLFPEFDLSELYKGDAVSRATANQIKFDRGVIDIDEWRQEDGRNALSGGVGKTRIIPLNMQQLPGTGAPELEPPDAAGVSETETAKESRV